ncbi:MAG: hypothetical protein H6592_12590 [Flavobacteriales bacterium]|nr:hypothetical protein [Flavobacteriales bacterium]
MEHGTFCLTDAPSQLFGSLSCDPDGNGTWLNPSGLAHNGTFQPATDEPGVYKYIVPGVGSCAADTALGDGGCAHTSNAGR